MPPVSQRATSAPQAPAASALNSLGANGFGGVSQALPSPTLGVSVLVLNRSFVAVHITNVRRAITLLFRQLAEVVHIEDGRFAAHSWNRGVSSRPCGRPSGRRTRTGCRAWATNCRPPV